jgi:hypothetical protein
MEINCPICHSEIIITNEDLGKKIQCPFCPQQIYIAESSLDDSLADQNQDVMLCSKCGSEQKEDAKFCHSCGHSLTETQPSGSSLTSTINTPQAQATASSHTAPSTAPSEEAKKWAMFVHFSVYFGYLIPVLGWFLAPLIIWQMKKEDPYVDTHGKIVMNWVIHQFSIYAVYAFLFMLSAMLISATQSELVEAITGVLLLTLIIFGIYCFIIPIVGGIKARNDKPWNYPIWVRWLK